MWGLSTQSGDTDALRTWWRALTWPGQRPVCIRHGDLALGTDGRGKRRAHVGEQRICPNVPSSFGPVHGLLGDGEVRRDRRCRYPIRHHAGETIAVDLTYG